MVWWGRRLVTPYKPNRGRGGVVEEETSNRGRGWGEGGDLSLQIGEEGGGGELHIMREVGHKVPV